MNHNKIIYWEMARSLITLLAECSDVRHYNIDPCRVSDNVSMHESLIDKLYVQLVDFHLIILLEFALHWTKCTINETIFESIDVACLRYLVGLFYTDKSFTFLVRF